MPYDWENRLTNSGGDTYAYGPDNLRIWKVRSDGSQDVYFYDPAGRKLAVYQVSKVSGGPQYYIGGSTMTPPEQQPQWFAGVVLARDLLGSGGAGAYYPYGEDYPNWAPVTDADNFATYYRDTTTGYDYAKNRYYSASLGRFLTADPSSANAFTDPGQWNKYSYVGNDPVNFNDPGGLFKCDPNDPKNPCVTQPVLALAGANISGTAFLAKAKNQARQKPKVVLPRLGSSAFSVNPDQQKRFGLAVKDAYNRLKNSHCAGLYGYEDYGQSTLEGTNYTLGVIFQPDSTNYATDTIAATQLVNGKPTTNVTINFVSSFSIWPQVT